MAKHSRYRLGPSLWRRLCWWRLLITPNERKRRYNELRALGCTRPEAQKGRDLRPAQYAMLVRRIERGEV